MAQPFSEAAVARFIKPDTATDVSTAIKALEASGMSPAGIASCLDLVAGGLSARPALEDVTDLVTTGPEVAGITNRDTVVVVRELFRRAERTVLVAGYAVYQGQRVFQALADRMQERPDLKVEMYLDIQRKTGDTSAASEIVAHFCHRFRTTQWPYERPLPEIFYDPRSLSLEIERRAALHAKCVVVDNLEVFVSSANFTEAAQQKNIEVGLLLRSSVIAERITRFFHCRRACKNVEI